jgi:hypothetical protein
MLAARISRYIDHLQDADYVGNVVSSAPMAELSRTLVSMLRGGDRQAAGDAALFAQDAVMFGLSPEFARYFPRSAVLRALRDNLFAADYFTRHQAIKTLGRVGPRSNAQHLAAAFHWYLEHDPLSMLAPRKPRGPYFEGVIDAPLYLARWSLLRHLLDHGAYPPLQVRGYLQRLADDPHALVRAEARWRLDQLEPGQLARDEPALTFFTLTQQVGNYLWISGRRDYDELLIERIVEYVTRHPPYAGMDIDAYWREFGS